ncbi:MAG: cysteine desulfurase [Candidatus Bathyarchaeota archaeon B26-2]|nr:MAG: cysteine desulfurase [Candidatus Bathyarchaeota archaeon B26-2]
MQRTVYLDNATTTAMDPKVLDAMKPYFFEWYGSPTHEYGHTFGLKAREALEKSREVVARSIGAKPEEIIFTSGGTESNNLAIKGLALANKEKRHLVTSRIEHTSVLNVIKSLEKTGFKASYINVDGEGFIDLEQLEDEINEETLLVSIQHANQEIGTIQDIEEIGKICEEKDVLFHVDAVQSFTKLPIDVEKMNIDLLSISAHKIHGPKGVGALYVGDGVKLKPLMDGGYNEFGVRPGTENVPGVVGFAKAIELVDEDQLENMRRLRDYLTDGLLEISDSRLNGPKGEKRLCNNVNITFRFVEGESVLLHLDIRGIIVTTGSACFSRSLQPSHVILALGLRHEDAHGSVRFSLSKYNTLEEMDYTIRNVREVVEQLRKISPVGR